jgi:hypothetical protein
MRVIKTGGLCVCVLALLAGAITAASASALPAYFECHKGETGSGEYADQHCTTLAEPGKGKWTLQEGIGKGRPIKGKNGPTTFHIPALSFEMSCKTGKQLGALATPTEESEFVVTFSSCVVAGKKCTTPGQAFGTIQTNNLKGTLGYISKVPLKVGVSYTAGVGSVIAEFSCEGLELVMSGALIGEQTGDINTFSPSFNNAFMVDGSDKQAVSKFEGGPHEVPEFVVNGSGPFEAGFQMTWALKGDDLEIVA